MDTSTETKPVPTAEVAVAAKQVATRTRATKATKKAPAKKATAKKAPAKKAPAKKATPVARKTPGKTATATGRLGSGELRGMVETFLRDNRGEHSPSAVAKVLGRSSGAVNNALEKLVTDGVAAKTQEAPKRFSLAKPTRRRGKTS